MADSGTSAGAGASGKTEKKGRNEEACRAGVKAAWDREKQLVLQGKGTRNWTVAQQAELIEFGTVRGFDGHHMKNASDYPQYADNPDNIQFISYEEHIYGAHNGNTQIETNGWFDPQTGVMHEFNGDELIPVPVIELSDKYDPSQYELTRRLGRDFGYGRREDNVESRKRHKGEKSVPRKVS